MTDLKSGTWLPRRGRPGFHFRSGSSVSVEATKPIELRGNANNFRRFSIRPPDVKRDSAGHNYARPAVKSAPRPFLCSAVVIPSSQPRTKPALPRTGVVKDGAATAKGGLSLTAPSTEACWMPLGPRKFFDAARRALLLFGMGTEALPVWDEEDEAEQSEGRPYRCSYGRHKQRSDLTSSFVPRGTPPPKAETGISS